MQPELLIPCDGVGVGWRRVPDPPPTEIVTDAGLLVSEDDDPDDLRYVLVTG